MPCLTISESELLKASATVFSKLRDRCLHCSNVTPFIHKANSLLQLPFTTPEESFIDAVRFIHDVNSSHIQIPIRKILSYSTGSIGSKT